MTAEAPLTFEERLDRLEERLEGIEHKLARVNEYVGYAGVVLQMALDNATAPTRGGAEADKAGAAR